MKKALLTGIAALLLATGAAHAEAGEVWRFNSYKRCAAIAEFQVYEYGKEKPNDWPWAMLARKDRTLGPRGGPEPSILEPPDTVQVTFERKHLAKLEAAVRFLKKCRACFWDRYTQKTNCLTPKQMKELDNAD
jgi:hypothetical protein